MQCSFWSSDFVIPSNFVIGHSSFPTLLATLIQKHHLHATFLLILDPHPQHLAALRVADGADRVRLGQFAKVLRVPHRLFNSFLQIVVHGFCNSSWSST